MTIALSILAGAALVLLLLAVRERLWSFRAQRPADYRGQTPGFDVRAALGGSYLCEGVLFDFTGRVRTRFRAHMQGELDARGGVLREQFIYQDGGRQDREWTLRFAEDGRLTATAPDIVGTARGWQAGDTLCMRYRLRLPESAGGHVLDVTDWMYMTGEGAILNRSEMRKFGVKVAELFAVLKHRAPAEAAS